MLSELIVTLAAAGSAQQILCCLYSAPVVSGWSDVTVRLVSQTVTAQSAMSLTWRSPAVMALAETLAISKQRCITLLAASSGDVERAADIYYSQQQQSSEQRRQQSRAKQKSSERQQPVDGGDEEAMQADDSDDERGDMPQLESPPSQPPPVAPNSFAAAVEPPAPSSAVVTHPPPTVRPVRQHSAPTAASPSSSPPPLTASRVKSEQGASERPTTAATATPTSLTGTAATAALSAPIKSKPALFAASLSSTNLKREPVTSSSSHSASPAALYSSKGSAPRLFSQPASSQLKAEHASSAAAHAAAAAASTSATPALTAISAHSTAASSTTAAAAGSAPRLERVAVRIVDTINPDTPAINMRFPLDTTLQRVYAELERRGFPGVALYHAKSQLSPELTPRELGLVDKCVLEMDYQHSAVEAAVAGGKRAAELKEAKPAAKRPRLGADRSGKEETELDDEQVNEEYKEAQASAASAHPTLPPVPAPSAEPSVVQPMSLHVEHPVTFNLLRLASVNVGICARAKTIPKRNHNFADLFAAFQGGIIPPTMQVVSEQDRVLLQLIDLINSGQRHPIGVEVRWQRVQASHSTDSSRKHGSSTASSEPPSVFSATMTLLRAAMGQLEQPRQQQTFKWLHTFEFELHLLPVCVGWSITHMNELLELLWGNQWQQLTSRVWSDRYQPGDSKPMPPMDQSALLRMAQRFEYRATLDDSVLSEQYVPPTSSSSSSDSAPVASGCSLSPFPFRPPRPYESSESVGLRYLVQRERQKAVSSWLTAPELDPHQLSLESCVGLSLRDYQQQSVLWMLGQELRDSVSEAFWLECRVDGQPLLYSPLFQQWRTGPLECTRGGLLCDTMGLGKSIVSLALINLRPAPADFVSSSLAASHVASPTRPVRSRATLVIAPVSLVPQWETELRQHSLRPLRIYCFYGSSRETDPRVIAQYDVVLTTYGVLTSDTSGKRFKRRKGAASVFHCIEWWRVLVDEGHLLRANKTAQTGAATAILSQQRHILTGTPISSSVTELRGLFSFLQCAVLADSPSFWSHLQAASRAVPSALPPTPEEELSYRHMTFPPHAVYAVAENIFCRLSMRHTKDQPFNGRPTLAPLPPRTDVVHKVDFTPTQRAAYDELHNIARRKWDDIVRRGAGSSSIIAALSYLLPLRQACAGTIIDMAEVRRRETEAAQRMEEARRAEESRQAHSAAGARLLLAALPADADDNDDEADEAGNDRQFAYATTLPYNRLEDECVVCLTGDHRVLTRRGWQSITCVAVGEWAMTFNTQSYEMEWKRVTGVTSHRVDPLKQQDKLYRMQSSSVDVIATSDHRMLLVNHDGPQHANSPSRPNGLTVTKQIGYARMGELATSYALTDRDSSHGVRSAYNQCRSVVCTGINRQPSKKIVVPGLANVCEWWWRRDGQLGFLEFLGLWLGDGWLATADELVCITVHKPVGVQWLKALMRCVFPRWHYVYTIPAQLDRHLFVVRCPPLYEYLRKMAVGPVGYNPRDRVHLRGYPHFSQHDGLAEEEQRSPYYRAGNSSGNRGTWTEAAMLRSFLTASAAVPERCWWCGEVEWESGNEMLLCDGEGCNRGGHVQCAGFTAVPENDWVCPACLHFVPLVSAATKQEDDVELEEQKEDEPAAAADDDPAVEEEVVGEEGKTTGIPSAEAVVDVAKDEEMERQLRAAGKSVWWNDGEWLIINGHWYCLKRWLGDQQQISDVYSQLSRRQAVALLDGFCRADGTWSSIAYANDGLEVRPTANWHCTSSSFPLIDHLQLIAQLAGARVSLSRHTAAGKPTSIGGRQVKFNVDHWALCFDFAESPLGVPFPHVSIAVPEDVTDDSDNKRGNFEYEDDGCVYCITCDSQGDVNANFLTQRLALHRVAQVKHSTVEGQSLTVRALSMYVGNCLSEFNLPLQTKCGHLFCAECILSVIDMESEPTCPQCRARVTKATLRRPRPRLKTPPPPPPPDIKQETAVISSSSAASPSAAAAAAAGTTSTAVAAASTSSLPAENVVFDSKLEVVVSHLMQLQRSDPGTKALVFSQFASTLSYLGGRLSALHVPVHRISGDMPMGARRRVLHNFNSTAAFSVFLLTPRVGAVGLTLTSASHCYIIEPALNWTLTEQAVGRVHRLGQQRPVTCVHYVMRASVEEHIRAITRDKQAGRRAADGAADSGSSSSTGPAGGGESAGIGSDAMIGLNSMGSMKKDAAVYAVQELEKLFER